MDDEYAPPGVFSLLDPDGIVTFSNLGGKGGGGRFTPTPGPVTGEIGVLLAEGDRGKSGLPLTRAAYGGGATGDGTWEPDAEGVVVVVPLNAFSYALYPGSIAVVYVFSATFDSACGHEHHDTPGRVRKSSSRCGCRDETVSRLTSLIIPTVDFVTFTVLTLAL